MRWCCLPIGKRPLLPHNGRWDAGTARHVNPNIVRIPGKGAHMALPDWVAVDWGTSNLRAWAMAGDGSVLQQASSAKGMGRLKPDDFAHALLELTDSWIVGTNLVRVVACGMVGADKGWVHAPYRSTPCLPIGKGGFASPRSSPVLMTVLVVPGISTLEPSPDVMRGEETQIAGLLSLHSDFEGVVCLPGTHTKWVNIEAGRITGFRTYMTGELFELLGQRSILRHSVDSDLWCTEAFVEALDESYRDPGELAAGLFSIRAGSLLTGLTPGRATARLAGLLVGTELQSTGPIWRGKEVFLLGAGKALDSYRTAFRFIGKEFRELDSETAVIAGLRHANLLAGQS